MKNRPSKMRARGQSLVEFSLVLPLFLLMLFGLIDFSRLLFTYISLSNGTREMARIALLSSNTNMNLPVDAFNNLSIFAGAFTSGDSDSVTINVYDETGAAQGTTTCPMPLTYASCSVPSTSGLHDGWVDVSASYVFHFNPLFQNRLSGVVDVSVLQPISTLQTSVRSYIE